MSDLEGILSRRDALKFIGAFAVGAFLPNSFGCNQGGSSNPLPPAQPEYPMRLLSWYVDKSAVSGGLVTKLTEPDIYIPFSNSVTTGSSGQHKLDEVIYLQKVDTDGNLLAGTEVYGTINLIDDNRTAVFKPLLLDGSAEYALVINSHVGGQPAIFHTDNTGIKYALDANSDGVSAADDRYVSPADSLLKTKSLEYTVGFRITVQDDQGNFYDVPAQDGQDPFEYTLIPEEWAQVLLAGISTQRNGEVEVTGTGLERFVENYRKLPVNARDYLFGDKDKDGKSTGSANRQEFEETFIIDRDGDGSIQNEPFRPYLVVFNFNVS